MRTAFASYFSFIITEYSLVESKTEVDRDVMSFAGI